MFKFNLLIKVVDFGVFFIIGWGGRINIDRYLLFIRGFFYKFFFMFVFL